MKYASLFSMSLIAMTLANASVSGAHADENAKKTHPRRAQVNKRLKNQQKRVNQGLAKGSLTPAEAQKIQGQDAKIRAEEQRDAVAPAGK
ncbi:MAG: hypothetical protein P4M08_06050 [Oligoflexia bacterium]|nr:hypothetical protein [Oligoflexia bacterium]